MDTYNRTYIVLGNVWKIDSQKAPSSPVTASKFVTFKSSDMPISCKVRRHISAIVVSLIFPALLSLNGCSYIAERVATGVEQKLDKVVSARLEDSINISFPPVDSIFDCLKAPDLACSTCKPGIGRSADSNTPEVWLTADDFEMVATAHANTDKGRYLNVQKKLLALYLYLTGHVEENSYRQHSNQIAFTRTELEGYVDYASQALVESPDTYFRFATSSGIPVDNAEKPRLDNIDDFFKAYFSAYMRNGKFGTIIIDTSALKDLKEALFLKLKDQVPGIKERSDYGYDEFNALLKKYFPILDILDKGSVQFGKIADSAFVTRDGDSYQFPPLSLKISPLADKTVSSPNIDFSEVGANLIRLSGEAIGDSLSRLPAVSTATGVKLKKDSNGRVGLDVFKPAGEKGGMCLLEDDFELVNEVANELEATTSAATGQAIRGISLFSLNNESLAKLFESLVGVVVRKATEAVAWCTIACWRNYNPPHIDHVIVNAGDDSKISAADLLKDLGQDRQTSVRARSERKFRKIKVDLEFQANHE